MQPRGCLCRCPCLRSLAAFVWNRLDCLDQLLQRGQRLHVEALEPQHVQGALLRGAQHTLQLLAPYLELEQRKHLMSLTAAYAPSASRTPDTPGSSPKMAAA